MTGLPAYESVITGRDLSDGLATAGTKSAPPGGSQRAKAPVSFPSGTYHDLRSPFQRAPNALASSFSANGTFKNIILNHSATATCLFYRLSGDKRCAMRKCVYAYDRTSHPYPGRSGRTMATAAAGSARLTARAA